MKFGVEDKYSWVCDYIIKLGLLFLIVFTPLVFGSVQPWAYTTMGVVLLILLGVWFSKMIWKGKLEFARLSFMYPLALFAGVVIFQIVPLSDVALSKISPLTHEIYESVLLEGFGGKVQPNGEKNNQSPGFIRPISLNPHATKTGLIKVLSYFAVFLLVVNNVRSRKDVRFFLWTLVISGFFFSLFALAQKYSWNGMMYWFIHPIPGQSPFGPYINRNHFAGYAGMIIPLSVGLGLSGVARYSHLVRSDKDKLRPVHWGKPDSGRRLTILFMSALMAAALFVSLSRGGMVSFLVSMTSMSLMLLGRGERGRWPRAMILTLGLTFLLVFVIGFEQVGGRIATLLNSEAIAREMIRPRLWKTAIRILWDFPLFGTGLAAFSSVFPLYQTSGTQGVTDLYAHNDYLQLLAETGFLGGFTLLIALLLFLVHVVKRFRSLRDYRMITFAAGGISACVAIAVHSVVDFNLYIPANAFHLALIMGLLVVMVNLRGGDDDTQRFTLPFVIIPIDRRQRYVWHGFIFSLSVFLAMALISISETKGEAQFRTGERYYSQMLSRIQNDPLHAAKDGARAIGAYRTTLLHDPLNSSSYFQMGKTIHKLRMMKVSTGARTPKEFIDHEKLFRVALRFSPTDSKLHYDIGMYYLKNWDSFLPAERSLGKLIFIKALRLNPRLKYHARKALLRLKRNGLQPEAVRFMEGVPEIGRAKSR